MKTYYISILIFTYNREKKLADTMRALFKQKYPLDHYEIIVSDDGSSDGTSEVVKALQAESPCKLVYVQNLHRGVAATINSGAKKSSGDVLILLGDDVITSPTFLEEYNRAYNKYPDIAGVAGYTCPLSTTIFARHEWFMTQYYLKFNFEERVMKKGEAVSNPISVKRNIFFEIGGISEKIKYARGDDSEVIEKLYEKGYAMVSIPTKTIHMQDYNLRGFIKSAENRGTEGRRYLLGNNYKFPRLRFAVKFTLMPLLFFKYWYDFAKFGRILSIDMVAMRTVFNAVSSLYAVFG
ncbi:MAG: glycosyltransferase family 2 protein [Candidatus Micrarchaeota archaeon]|nr:glycosyltransferase family 2 protein [Candidatus Micrarchaeota archaeon]